MAFTRTIAMYLPQFHEIPENSRWWGEGYTEWTAVRKAEPAFPGHQQPVIPLQENYYDLLSKDTMVWQADMAHKYGVDGFCFYHYWFGKDRKILEKPAENLLQWKDIDLPFCFCWDPGSWARTWTKIGNAWADRFEKSKAKDDTSGNGVLIQQDYGDESFWRAHFAYLLRFFQDKRYIRVDGKPVFLFYHAMYMPCLARMAALWRRLAIQAGLPGLYLVGYRMPNTALDAVIYSMDFSRESFVYDPVSAHRIEGTSMLGYNYDEVWQNFLLNPPCASQRTLWSGTVSYDDSPRRGENGRIYLHASPQKFQHYFGQLMRKSREEQSPLLFLDAWNEWGEGKKLEPDMLTGYQYLEAVRAVVQADTDALPALPPEKLVEGQRAYTRNVEAMAQRFQQFAVMFRNWKNCDQAGRRLDSYFVAHHMPRIAIYGFGQNGICFYRDIKDSEQVQVAYVIDNRKGGMTGKTPVPVFSPQDELPAVDAVVVSVVDEYDVIAAMLQAKLEAPIISLVEVVAAVAEQA